jgi:hypothetical protein
MPQVYVGQEICRLMSVQDVVGPNTTMEVKVFMQQSKDLTAAAAADCRDKFLIQSTPVPFDWVRSIMRPLVPFLKHASRRDEEFLFLYALVAILDGVDVPVLSTTFPANRWFRK